MLTNIRWLLAWPFLVAGLLLVGVSCIIAGDFSKNLQDFRKAAKRD